MARTAKRALKRHVEAWLSELDACFKKRKQEWEWDPGKRKPVYLDVLAYPAPVEHTQRLHQLIQADYSPLIPRASMNEYIRKLESSGERVPLERKEFPANHYWIIIKKWNRWRRLRVIPRIERYVNRHCEFWESEWNLRGGRVSPYTREWIQYRESGRCSPVDLRLRARGRTAQKMGEAISCRVYHAAY